jgi:hypothetical protein
MRIHGHKRAAQTVVALFDDQIDAEMALTSLRKVARSAAHISVLARDRQIEEEERPDSAVDVTRAVVDTAMTTVTGWLTGLAALLVPDQGHFLAAGPIGAVLAKLRPDEVASAPSHSATPASSAPVGSVGLALERFGFRPDEAHYLEQRLAAGSSMIAVTSTERGQIKATLRCFADNGAVFIGQAETPPEVLAEAEQGIVDPLSAASSEVIVADVVAPLEHASDGNPHEVALHDRAVVDQDGAPLGDIDDALVEGDSRVLRYLIVGHGGLLGIARRRVAVPAELADLETNPIRIAADQPSFAQAPGYDPEEPFSRKHEQAIYDYFGLRPYWEGQSVPLG